MLRKLHRFGLRNFLMSASFVDSTSMRIETRMRNDIFSNSKPLKRVYTSKTNDNIRQITSNSISVCYNSETVNLLFDDETRIRCPFVWLRDNCRCQTCHDTSSGHRLRRLENLDLDVHPINAAMHPTGQSMIVHWSDEHRSEYPVNWLKNVRFPASMDPIDGLDLKCWGSEMTRDKVPTFSFHDIMSDESSLYAWLASLHTYGISIVNNLGDDDKNLTRLAQRVSHPKMTCHGTDFAVKLKSEPTNLAYTGYRLGLHTDLTYYSYEPGVQMLHCIRKSEYGGLSEFADGFKVAYDLQREDPETFEILSTVPVAHVDWGISGISKTDYVLRDWKPIIRMKDNGQVKQIALNCSKYDTRMSVNVEDVKNVYRAMKVFYTALYRKDNLVSFMLQEGEAICVNNFRALHGRSEFTVPPGCQTPRHLQGNYIDWDEIYSRMRGITGKRK